MSYSTNTFSPFTNYYIRERGKRGDERRTALTNPIFISSVKQKISLDEDIDWTPYMAGGVRGFSYLADHQSQTAFF